MYKRLTASTYEEFLDTALSDFTEEIPVGKENRWDMSMLATLVTKKET